MRKAEWFLLGIVAFSVATGLAFYSSVPEMMASHWDMAGNVDGYISKPWGIFLFPAIFVVIFLVFFIIPRIDPRREHIEHFRKYFDRFIIGFGVLFYYIYLLTLIWNIGDRFNFFDLLIIPLAALFYFIGMLLPHTKSNFTIGIRTPWTISSETVWKKTHEVGGQAFKFCGVVSLLGIVLPDFAIWFLVVPLAVATLGLVIYSYVLYVEEKH